MAKYRRRIDIKGIITAIFAVAILAGIIAVCVAFFGKDTKTISFASFSTGDLDANGEFTKSATTVYTKDYFECQGLAVEIDFESSSEYEVFYYREDKSFIGSTGALDDYYEKGLTYDNAKYAKIVIYPELEAGVTKIALWDVWKYAKDLKITVNKDQTFEAPLIAVAPTVRGDYEEVISGTTYHAVRIADGPFILAGDYLDAFENHTVKSISLPVAGVVNHKEDSTFTVYVVEGDGTKTYREVQKHEFVIPANTFKSSLGVVNPNDNAVTNGASAAWFDFECNIRVEEGQTLAFGSTEDSVYWIYRKSFTEDTCRYPMYNAIFNKSTYTPWHTLEIYFDVKYLE